MGDRRGFTDPAFVRSARGQGEPAREPRRERPSSAGSPVTGVLVRLALVGALAYLGALTLAGALSAPMQPLVTGSPILSWLYRRFGAGDAERILAGVELGTALLLAVRPVAPRLSIAGSVLAIFFFLGSLSLVLTTPGSFTTMPGLWIPLPSPTAAFLMKDVFLLGASVWTLAEAVHAAGR
jgi:reactive chlorine resistance protein C